MKSHLFLLLLAAGMLTSCLPLQQQQYQAGFTRLAQSELQLLHYAATQAARAEICTRLLDEDRRTITYPLPEEELQQLKEILSGTTLTPCRSWNKSPLWPHVEVGIKLYNREGIFLFELNENMLESSEACANGAHALFTLPGAQLKQLRALPTLLQAKEHKSTEDRYARHCRHRATTAEKIRQAAGNTHSARVRLEHLDGTEVHIDLDEEELQQLKQILDTAGPLPALNRADWDTPDNHCMPVPPLLVFSYLELLDSEGEKIYNIPLDYQYLAAQSDLEQLSHSEGEGQVAILPDEQKAAFNTLPFQAKVHEKRAELRNEARLYSAFD